MAQLEPSNLEDSPLSEGRSRLETTKLGNLKIGKFIHIKQWLQSGLKSQVLLWLLKCESHW